MNIEHIRSMMHSPVYNYIVPGLTSWLIGNPSDKGKVRLFVCERNHKEFIAPHSHRYDFHCMVLKGQVKNYIYQEHAQGEDMVCSTLVYDGEIGRFKTISEEIRRYQTWEGNYTSGQDYEMRHDQIHSIYFAKDTWVLFLEGAEKCDTSVMLEPYVQNKRVPTGQTMDWMFERAA